ncbi:HEAT repeat domain-containing protein [Gimesia sp.]|uniref:HEAT repeat domain-containing protein n=1 Tax=Gimesia sp. TaxID=2024833 RepID=UPI003A952DFB
MSDALNQAGSGDPRISEWISQLDSTDSELRQAARKSLTKLGKPAVPALAEALGDASEMRRWEAAKSLEAICDPAAVPALVEALTDDTSVKWVAGDALIALDEKAVPEILHALIKDPAEFRDGACFVLHHLASDNEDLRDILTPVIQAMKSLDSSMTVPIQALDALSKISAVDS